MQFPYKLKNITRGSNLTTRTCVKPFAFIPKPDSINLGVTREKGRERLCQVYSRNNPSTFVYKLHLLFSEQNYSIKRIKRFPQNHSLFQQILGWYYNKYWNQDIPKFRILLQDLKILYHVQNLNIKLQLILNEFWTV